MLQIGIHYRDVGRARSEQTFDASCCETAPADPSGSGSKATCPIVHGAGENRRKVVSAAALSEVPVAAFSNHSLFSSRPF